MIELRNDSLDFRFPGVHEDAACSIDFQRTLRIPDDNNPYPLPPGLGRFPVTHVDDYAEKLPEDWVTHGGVFIPMYQSEALWINFHGSYPCALKIAAGKINAVDGSAWSPQLSDSEQDYVITPEQRWLDGFNVTEDYIRQFVAMPLGEGYTAEEQITGEAVHGGLQVIAHPMKSELYKELLERKRRRRERFANRVFDSGSEPPLMFGSCDNEPMGLAPGGLMRQEICDDPHGIAAWDQDNGVRCFIHLVNSQVYAEITGSAPPHKPPTAKNYNAAGLPWFEYYSDSSNVGGSEVLGGLTSLGAKHIQQEGQSLSDNTSIQPKVVKSISTKHVVRQGEF